MSRFWIVDGHNVIFAIPRLKSLQLTERREEARERLVDALRRFALARKDPLLVVFDGDDLPSRQEALRGPLLEVVYSRRRPDGADERIIVEARALVQQGHQVTVVTNDVITLAAKLPKAVQHLKVRPFWERHIERKADKPVEGDFSDIETEMLARAAAAGAEVEDSGRPAAATASGSRDRAGKDTVRERLRLKKERGRARHQRRFRRH
ncbi:MAG TPA: NYN domain-containing protein [Candidatus Polarisedimenticolia bacterium]|nr:NYN domain-containing protein [Candidatus Polarisedimenticolia bacterium]